MIIRIAKLVMFRKKWRKVNKHNFTSVKRLFDINKVKVGNGTYGSLTIYAYSDLKERLDIGNYVSIAGEVKFILGGNHHMDRFMSYPFSVYSYRDKDDAYTKGPIIIDDDVWIGTGAIILSGVHIGKGAVVAAGTIVANDVPPYAIVAGSPARIIKYRFTKETIDELMKLDYSKINSDFIMSNRELLEQKMSIEILRSIGEKLDGD